MNAPDRPQSGRAAARIALGYAAVAVVWILGSDTLLERLVSDPQLRVSIGIAKGWLFVAVTAALLFLVMRRTIARIEAAQDARVEAMNLLAALSEASPDAIFAKDLDGRYRLFNRAAGEMVGQAPADVLGRDDRALFPPAEAEMLMALDRRLLQSDQAEAGEERLTTAQGERLFLTTKGPLRAPDGRVIGTYGIARDISVREQVEQALRDRERMLAAIVGHSPSALSIKRPDGRYTLANPNLQRIHHGDEASIVGKTDAELYPAEVAAQLRANDALVMRNRTNHSVEEQLPVDGRMRTFMSHIFPVLDEHGAVAHICRISLDITERKQAEQALLNRNAELERFNQAMVGRELDMVGLKQQINRLSAELGRPPPYAPADLPPAGKA